METNRLSCCFIDYSNILIANSPYYLLKKILPVSSNLLLFTITPPHTHTHIHTHTHTHTIQPCEKPLDPRITTRKSLDPRNSQEKKVWINEIQMHDGTNPPDPRNLVHFVKNDWQKKSANGNHETEKPNAKMFYFFHFSSC